jgi:aspartyl-tRNA(Asn)/glutamyl-tRNA(Gln) amidotransferase subunit B
MSVFGLSSYDAGVLTDDRAFSDYYDALVAGNVLYKPSANWMLGPVRSWLNEKGREIEDFPMEPRRLASLIQFVNSGRISFTAASGPVFLRMLEDPCSEPESIANELNLLQESDEAILIPIVDEVLRKFAGKVAEYNKGKKGVLALFVGEVMKRSMGKADPKLVNELINERIKNK